MITTPMTPAQHAAIHRLARQARCACPGCCSGRKKNQVESTADDAFGRLRRAISGSTEASRTRTATPTNPRFRNIKPASVSRLAPPRRPPGLTPLTGPQRSRTIAQASQAALAHLRRSAPPAPPGPRRQLRSVPGAAPPPPPLAQAERALLRSLGYRQFAPAQATMLDLANLARAAGLSQSYTARNRREVSRYSINDMDRVRQLTHSDPRFANLRPLFEPVQTQQVYNIAGGPGPQSQSLYVGRTRDSPGERLLQHIFGQGRQQVDIELRRMFHRDPNALANLHIQTGSFANLPAASDQTRRGHLGEVALHDLHQPQWNHPSRHGFEEGDSL